MCSQFVQSEQLNLMFHGSELAWSIFPVQWITTMLLECSSCGAALAVTSEAIYWNGSVFFCTMHKASIMFWSES